MADRELETEIETVEPISPRDDIDNDVRAAIAKLKGTDEPPTAEDGDEPVGVPPTAAKPVDDKVIAAKERDPETGKFVPKSTEAPVKAASEPKLPPAETAKASTEQPSTAASAPPVSWAAEAKASWAAIPPAIQNAVLKREAEVSAGFKQKSDENRQYEAAFAPVAAMSQRYGVPAAEGIKRLVAANEFLERDAPAAIAWLAKSHGVDLAALVSNPPAIQTPRVDPMVSQLGQHVTSLESQLNGFLQNQTLGVVDSFAKDPAHPHYAEVENELVRLIPMIQQSEAGLSHHEILQKAYDQAIWLNPTVREKVLAQQTAATAQAKTAMVQAKAVQSRKAAVSIKGSSNGAMPPPRGAPAGGDVYDDVRAAINQLQG